MAGEPIFGPNHYWLVKFYDLSLPVILWQLLNGKVTGYLLKISGKEKGGYIPACFQHLGP